MRMSELGAITLTWRGFFVLCSLLHKCALFIEPELLNIVTEFHEIALYVVDLCRET